MAAAAGFVVLVPQMGPDNGRLYGMVTRDVCFEVPSGVLPAVDKAIEQGIADPQRLFVEGLSMGGFATYAVIQQTPRFRAALAEVGVSSWINGSFSARGRYGEDVAQLGIGWNGENVQQRPGAQILWSDLGLSLFWRANRADYLECVRDRIKPELCDATGKWTADYVRLWFAAQWCNT